MAFKLGRSSSRKPIAQSGNLKSTPVYRKKLQEGIKGEAYADGTIAISIDVKPNSSKYKEVLAHENDHVNRIKNKELTYGENYIKWRNNFYKRKKGHIEYKGEWYAEGHPHLPWEALAFKASNKAKKS
jgi:hypothetical protein